MATPDPAPLAIAEALEELSTRECLGIALESAYQADRQGHPHAFRRWMVAIRELTALARQEREAKG